MRRSLLTDRAKFRRREPGFIITLVAVFLLFVVGAMAALSIDIASFYTARSEAQIAADAAALAGARALANSGFASEASPPIGLWAQVKALCESVGAAVGRANQVGGQNLTAAQLTVTCTSPQTGNPIAKAQVQVNVPAFFARIWGTTQVSIAATATAEAYNPSLVATSTSLPQALPVALSCVKPWLIPNLDPGNPTNPIFATSTGAISATSLLGSSPSGMLVNCSPDDCSGGIQAPPTAWKYYPGDTATDFAPPPSASISCTPSTTGFTSTDYQLAVAGCVPAPIACNATGIHIDPTSYTGRNADTMAAVNCLSHSTNSQGDRIDIANPFPSGPFEFFPGTDNPLVVAGLPTTNDVVVSDSLVTVPVYDTTGVTSSSTTVNLVGFVQLFLNPTGVAAPATGPISTTVVNLIGCGTSASGNPIYGNGATAVPVRLISPP